MSASAEIGSPQYLAEMLRAGRERWLELEPGRRVLLRRPVESQLGQLTRGGADAYLACVVGWEGFTCGDVPAFVGDPAAELPFAPELAQELLGDRMEWASRIVNALADEIAQRMQEREARLGNSAPSSTLPPPAPSSRAQ